MTADPGPPLLARLQAIVLCLLRFIGGASAP